MIGIATACSNSRNGHNWCFTLDGQGNVAYNIGKRYFPNLATGNGAILRKRYLMKFAKKVHQLRTEKRLPQTELGNLCDISLRTICNHEVDGRYPKQRAVLYKARRSIGLRRQLFIIHGRAASAVSYKQREFHICK